MTSPAVVSAFADAGMPLREAFEHPAAKHRILKIIHGWPDSTRTQEDWIRTFQRQGFGGVVCNVSFQEYLESPARWEAFRKAITSAKNAGMALWLYDEKGYPSGTAGGLVLRDHPELEARGWLIADQEVQSGRVELGVPPGDLVLAAASRYRDGLVARDPQVDLKDFIREGRLNWDAPAGSWKVMVVTESRLYEGTHAQLSLADRTPYINLLDPEATARFLRVTHDRYTRELGGNLGTWFEATFTDEPSLMSLFLKPMPYRVLPWSSQLESEFKNRHGYALRPMLPVLVGDEGPDGKKVRYDFWQTVGELVSANFFGQIQQWCRAHGLPSGGHLLMEENVPAHVPLYGDFFRCIRRLDAPSVDCLTSYPPDVPWQIGRLLASAAELEEKRMVMSETSDHSQRWRGPNDKRPVQTVTEAEIRGTLNRQMVGGVNVFTSYYSFAGLADEQLRHLNDWVGRCCAVLREGCQVADIAVLYPAESLWPVSYPARYMAAASPQAARIEHIFRGVSDVLFDSQRDFTYVDARALTEAKVEGGTLSHGHLRWRVVILPGTDTLPLKTWRNLSRFVRSGGVLICAGGKPANNESEFPSPRVQKLFKELYAGVPEVGGQIANRAGGGVIFLPNGAEIMLPGLLDRLLEREIRIVDGSTVSLRVTHRRAQGQEVFFLVNDSPDSWQGKIDLSVSGRGEQWFPATGEVKSLNQGQGIVLDLKPYDATFLVFEGAVVPRRQPVRKGPLPNLVLRDLSIEEPRVSRGEFVREHLAKSSAGGWAVTGNITRSQVDTFLFTSFSCPDSAGLSRGSFLMLETRVPTGQRTPCQLLVVLHEKNGADYLASTGRMLGVEGWEFSQIAFHRFQLAGWSTDDNARLDLDQVSEIRVGWGGYLGQEGESVTFELRPPRLGILSSDHQ